MKISELSRKSSWSLNILVAIVMLMPYTMIGYFVMALCALFSIILTKSKVTIPGAILFIYFVLCFCINNIFTAGDNSFKDILNAVAIFLFVGFRSNIETHGINPKFVLVLLCVVLLSQIVVSMQIQPWRQIISDLYFDEGARSYGTVMSMAEIIRGSYVRAGGFLGNPNQCAKITNLIFAAYIARNIKEYFNYPLWIVYILIIAFAGSRTGMLVSIVLFLYFFYNRYKDKINLQALPFLLIFLFSLFFFGSYYFESHLSNMRMFDVESGMDSSFGVKMDVLDCYIAYLERINGYWYALFGNFFNSNSPSLIASLGNKLGFFDSDIGYLFYSYGLIGMFLIVYCLVIQFKICRISNLFIILFLWIASASVFMHFKFVLLFSMILRMSANTRLN